LGAEKKDLILQNSKIGSTCLWCWRDLTLRKKEGRERFLCNDKGAARDEFPRNLRILVETKKKKKKKKKPKRGGTPPETFKKRVSERRRRSITRRNQRSTKVVGKPEKSQGGGLSKVILEAVSWPLGRRHVDILYLG